MIDDGGGGGHHIEPVMAIPVNSDEPVQHRSSATNKPNLGDRLYAAFENGLVSGTQLGTTLATSQVVLDGMLSVTSTVVGSMTSTSSNRSKK
ncbi:hypothetical protein EON65_39020 [archaeon]|nr:MAG: hypothetical protein EON65_39020 [archaeon]